MEVKCPKCRYRYDTECEPGIKELSCVCPRCGTPFTVVIDSEKEADKPADEPLAEGLVPPAVPKTASSQSSAQPTSASNYENKYPDDEPQSSTEYQREKPRRNIPSTPLATPYSHLPAQKHAGCSLGCFISLILIVLIILFGLFRCGSEDEESANNNSTALTQKPKNDSSSYQVESVSKEDSLPTPDWIFGTWKVESEYGPIKVRIADKWICETVNDQESHGVFFYTKGQLNCDFHDGKIWVYKVDENRHRLDAGDGLWMTKISDN